MIFAFWSNKGTKKDYIGISKLTFCSNCKNMINMGVFRVYYSETYYSIFETKSEELGYFCQCPICDSIYESKANTDIKSYQIDYYDNISNFITIERKIEFPFFFILCLEKLNAFTNKNKNINMAIFSDLLSTIDKDDQNFKKCLDNQFFLNVVNFSDFNDVLIYLCRKYLSFSNIEVYEKDDFISFFTHRYRKKIRWLSQQMSLDDKINEIVAMLLLKNGNLINF